MTSGSIEARRATLLNLIELRVPLTAALNAVRRLLWDSDAELVILRVADVRHALTEFRDERLTANDIEQWAEAVEGREDIGFEPGQEDRLKHFLFEAANPELSRPVEQVCAEWLDQGAH